MAVKRGKYGLRVNYLIIFLRLDSIKYSKLLANFKKIPFAGKSGKYQLF